MTRETEPATPPKLPGVTRLDLMVGFAVLGFFVFLFNVLGVLFAALVLIVLVIKQRSGSISPIPPPKLTLLELMIGVGVVALAFAFLFHFLAVSTTGVVLGILVVKGLRLPVITDGPGLRSWLPWLVWWLSLAVCPVAMIVLKDRYGYVGPPTLGPPPMTPDRSWALEMVNTWSYVHLGCSCLAAVFVVLLTRGFRRWVAWAAILVMGVFTIGLAISVHETIYGWSW